MYIKVANIYGVLRETLTMQIDQAILELGDLFASALILELKTKTYVAMLFMDLF